jgi:hypothetical protein
MPYGQGPYAGVVYAGTGLAPLAPLSVKVTPAFGLALAAPASLVAGTSVSQAAMGLGTVPGAHNGTGTVLPSLQAAMGLSMAPGAALEVGTVIPRLQAAMGLGTGPGGLLRASMTLSLTATSAVGLGLSVIPHLGVAFTITSPAFGLGLKVTPVTQVEVALATQNLVSWAIGLSRPGKLVLYPIEPPVPPLTPDEEFPAWGFSDGVPGTTPESEFLDMSFDDPALVGARLKGDFLDLGYSDASMVAKAQGEPVDFGFNDSVSGVTPKAEPVAGMSFSDATTGTIPEGEPVDVSFSDAHP